MRIYVLLMSLLFMSFSMSAADSTNYLRIMSYNCENLFDYDYTAREMITTPVAVYFSKAVSVDVFKMLLGTILIILSLYFLFFSARIKTATTIPQQIKIERSKPMYLVINPPKNPASVLGTPMPRA